MRDGWLVERTKKNQQVAIGLQNLRGKLVLDGRRRTGGLVPDRVERKKKRSCKRGKGGIKNIQEGKPQSKICGVRVSCFGRKGKNESGPIGEKEANQSDPLCKKKGVRLNFRSTKSEGERDGREATWEVTRRKNERGFFYFQAAVAKKGGSARLGRGDRNNKRGGGVNR